MIRINKIIMLNKRIKRNKIKSMEYNKRATAFETSFKSLYFLVIFFVLLFIFFIAISFFSKYKFNKIYFDKQLKEYNEIFLEDSIKNKCIDYKFKPQIKDNINLNLGGVYCVLNYINKKNMNLRN